MAQLRNLINRQELRERIQNDPTPRTTISFYRYVKLEKPHEMRDQLYRDWFAMGMLGRIYLADEGINAQISIVSENVPKLRAYLDSRTEFKDVPFKIAVEDDGKSFIKLDIKVREKIVADGLDDDTFDASDVGTHVSAEEWNTLLDDPETVCVDMRNNYESEVGHFENAICPDVETFRDELPAVRDMLEDKKEKKVALYCTGGIRCEKASAYLRHHGFKNVYQLHGGIIDYSHQIKQEDLPCKFRGKNFVFDERRGERISDEIISHCHLCNALSDDHTNCENVECNKMLIQCSDCAAKLDGCCSEGCQEVVSNEQLTTNR